MTKTRDVFEILFLAARYADAFSNRNLDIRLEINTVGLIIITTKIWTTTGEKQEIDKHVIDWATLITSSVSIDMITSSIDTAVIKYDKREKAK